MITKMVVRQGSGAVNGDGFAGTPGAKGPGYSNENPLKGFKKVVLWRQGGPTDDVVPAPPCAGSAAGRGRPRAMTVIITMAVRLGPCAVNGDKSAGTPGAKGPGYPNENPLKGFA